MHKLKFYFFKGCNQAETRKPPAQDTLISHGVQSDTDTQILQLTKSPEDGPRIIQEMAQNLPKPPAVLDGNLPQYLLTLQETVSNDLKRLGPHLKGLGLMETLVECYHSQIFKLLDDLLQKINDTHSLFILMNWVLHSYLR